MKTKTLITILFTCIFFQISYSQVYKDRAKQFSYKYKDSRNAWTKWTPWEDCNILIVKNLDKNTFTIYSKETQEFDIIKFYEKEYDDEGKAIFRILCVDKDGLRCNIRERFVETEDYNSQLYVDYKDVSYVYNLVRRD